MTKNRAFRVKWQAVFALAFALVLALAALTSRTAFAEDEQPDGTEAAVADIAADEVTAAADVEVADKASAQATLGDSASGESAAEAVDDDSSATVTIAQGESGTISNVTPRDDWRVVDSKGESVSDVTVTPPSSGGGWRQQTYYLTVSATESAAEGTYKIQYGTTSGHEPDQITTWEDSGYTVQVKQYVLPSKYAGEIKKGSGKGSSSTSTEPEPSISKSATKYEGDDNFTYDLALTVSSSVGSVESPIAIDLLFIIDRSGSMGKGNDQSVYNDMMNETNQAVIDATASLSKNSNLDMRYAVVSFSGDKEYDDDAWDDATTNVSWTSNPITSLNISANGGTNYEAGLLQGRSLLTSARENAYKYVIFLSDGQPTFHYESDGSTGGNGYGNASAADYNHAVGVMKTLDGINGFYTVFVASSSSKITATNTQYLTMMREAIKEVDSTVTVDNVNYVKGSTVSLDEIFSKFVKEATSIACTNVAVSDTLSEWVVPTANATPYVVIKVTADDGTVTTYSSKDNNLPEAEQGITASYDSSTKQLKLNFPKDYSLKSGYTYEVHMDIEPTETAKSRGTSGYDLTADANTGTHAGDSGYKSNADDSAKLTYTVNDAEKSMDYPKPVVHVPDSWTLTITKTLSGNMYNENDTFSFTVTSDKASIQTTTGSSDGVTATISEDGKIATVTLGKDKTVALKVPNGATVTVTEGTNSYTTTTYSVADGQTVGTQSGLTYKISSISANTNVTVENEKEITIDTGISLDSAGPVAVGLIAAAGIAVVALRCKMRAGRED